MRLTRLAAARFRNLEPFDRKVTTSFVVLHGANAQGKTNVLEAVYLLATLKPLRARRPRDLVRWGDEAAWVAALVSSKGAERKLRVVLEGSKRRAEVDGKTATLDAYFEWARAIAFVPSDTGIVTGEPARRRNWVDRAAFTAHPAHLDAVKRYKRALDQKAAALRANVADAVLDAIDDGLAESGARLVERRTALVDEIAPHVRAIHTMLAAERGALALHYRTAAVGETVARRADALRGRIADARRQERQRRMVLVGPHLDDVEVALEDRSARAWGSQGQVRSVVLALKLAEMVAASRRGGDMPLFLVDDIGSELDRDRKRRLVEVLRELEAQVFLTTTDPEHLVDLPKGDTEFVRIEGGKLY